MRKTFLIATALSLAASVAAVPAGATVQGKPVHGLSLHGEPKYGPDFKHFDYVNPTAPKGGSFRYGIPGSFDSLNPFSAKGTAAGLLQPLGAGSYFYFIEPLTARGSDEANGTYCLLCETVEVAPDNTWVEYALRPQAKFHDGSPVTVEDVIFSFEVLMEKGQPLYQLYWGDVTKAEKTGERKVRFHFKSGDNAELPLIMGELPVLSKAYWSKHDVAESSVDIPVSSGPYRIDRFEQGRFIVYKRDPNYWGKDLPVVQGAHNFDEVRLDYYRDPEVAFEAFKAYEFDVRFENSSANWATAYDEGLVKAGLMVKETVKDGEPDQIQVFTMNLRRSKFADRRVRQALALAFDFDWGNENLSYGLFAPMMSYYGGSELAQSGLPQGEELAILEKVRDKVPPEVFTTPYSPPRTDGSGNNRENLRKARDLLAQAGWAPKDGKLINTKTGESLEIEFLLAQEVMQKWINPYIKNLGVLGIPAQIRMVEFTQYVNRINTYDFDMVVGGQGQSLSPGNEQREIWGTASADQPGGRNWGGIKDPGVDAIIEELIQAKTRESLIAHTRALDRVLLWNWYSVPQFTTPGQWWAYWNKYGRPEKIPVHGPDLALWWYDAEKAKKVEADRSR